VKPSRLLELIPPVHPREPRRVPSPRPLLALSLLVVTFGTTTTLGAVWWRLTRFDAPPDLLPWLSPHTVARVWGDPELLGAGLAFAVTALGILLVHEMGHYLTCRHHRLPSTLPRFLPAPVALGTFGAFLRIRTAIRGKRELFDVGASGPLAGFVVLLPALWWGVAASEVAPWPHPAHPAQAGQTGPGTEPGVLAPGQCLALWLTTHLLHGPLPEGMTLLLHPVALGAWLGLLATAINLLPLAQLDGGHILYAVAGARQRRWARPLWLLLLAAGFWWSGWFLWCLIVGLMGLSHPPVRDETTPLDRPRKWLALACLVVFVLSFMPVPIRWR
jgi:membrane-associated protease RseP (regulator of RpoE activity)